jgi:type VI secretion system protein VasD
MKIILILSRLGWFIAVIGLNGCSLLSHAPQMNISIKSARYLNPDVDNDASPLVLKIYELKNSLQFDQVDFLELSNHAISVLKDTLIDQHVIVVRPNENSHLSLTMSPQTRYLGITAAYRYLIFSDWKKMIAVNRSSMTHIDIFLGTNSFTVEKR